MLRIMLLIVMLVTINPLTLAQDDDYCDFEALQSAYIDALTEAEDLAALTELVESLEFHFKACSTAPTPLLQTGNWQWKYEEGPNWERECPNGNVVAYPEAEFTLTQDGDSYITSPGGQFRLIEPGVYVLTQPYTAGTATVITERWEIVDEQRIIGHSWEYYENIDCVLETEFEMIYIGEGKADI